MKLLAELPAAPTIDKILAAGLPRRVAGASSRSVGMVLPMSPDLKVGECTIPDILVGAIELLIPCYEEDAARGKANKQHHYAEQLRRDQEEAQMMQRKSIPFEGPGLAIGG